MFAGYQVPNMGYDKDWYRMAPSVAALGTSFDPSQNPTLPTNRIGPMDFCSTEYPYDVLAYGIDQEAVGTNSGEFFDPTYDQPSVFPPCGRKFTSYYRKNLTNISGDQWYHVTIVIKKMNSSRYDKRLYINGALIGSKYNNGKYVAGIAIDMDPGYEPEHYINEWEMLTPGYAKVAELAIWQKDITEGKSFYEVPDAPLYVKNDQDVYVPNPQLSWI